MSGDCCHPMVPTLISLFPFMSCCRLGREPTLPPRRAGNCSSICRDFLLFIERFSCRDLVGDCWREKGRLCPLHRSVEERMGEGGGRRLVWAVTRPPPQRKKEVVEEKEEEEGGVVVDEGGRGARGLPLAESSRYLLDRLMFISRALILLFSLMKTLSFWLEPCTAPPFNNMAFPSVDEGEAWKSHWRYHSPPGLQGDLALQAPVWKRDRY
ncbi:hypothetical protein F7725_027626 [Dissostichus mawsoni]|uniref:Uncharacterized protein n=1 Tax=Dissostichus mawsoni TaxID=36200 RepID=A0A7J5XFS3_DISMA|nr:hypothetical protein F7725_027626 [Dissostichus mawsoni]